MLGEPKMKEQRMRKAHSTADVVIDDAHQALHPTVEASNVRIRPVDASIVGKDTWFEIAYADSQLTRFFSCHSSRERDQWVQSLKRSIQGQIHDMQRVDNSLELSVLELKTNMEKMRQKVFVEVYIDNRLYARSSKSQLDESGSCFFGEHFNLLDLPPKCQTLSLALFKEKSGNNAKKIASFNLQLANLASSSQERWHRLTTLNNGRLQKRCNWPAIRVRARFLSLDILPLSCYDDLGKLMRERCADICSLLEPLLQVKQKEELALALMSYLHLEQMAEMALVKIIANELETCEDQHLLFRANSVATKAMEIYMKMVGAKYLATTLQCVVTEILLSEVDLEVDVTKIDSLSALESNRANLMTAIKQVWTRIVNSVAHFPLELRRCFHHLRKNVDKNERDLGDTLVSSCIFLRYLCPAILNPNLFGLTKAFPGAKANRNLTLVAKALQTLANRTRCDKQEQLQFLNPFLDQEREAMRAFLRQISSPLPAADLHLTSDNTKGSFTLEEQLGRQLARLQCILSEHLPLLNEDALLQARVAEVLRQLVREHRVLDEDPSSKVFSKSCSKSMLWSNSLPRKSTKLCLLSSKQTLTNGLRRGSSSTTLHRRGECMASHFSLDSSTSSEDSCYSSQHNNNNSEILRNYEQELIELRQAMSSLRARLEVAEKKLDVDKKEDAVTMEDNRVVVRIGNFREDNNNNNNNLIHLWPATQI